MSVETLNCVGGWKSKKSCNGGNFEFNRSTLNPRLNFIIHSEVEISIEYLNKTIIASVVEKEITPPDGSKKMFNMDILSFKELKRHNLTKFNTSLLEGILIEFEGFCIFAQSFKPMSCF